VRSRDGNSGTGIRMIFYLWVTFVSDLNRDGYGTGIFFHLRLNTRYFTTAIILCYEQVKMYSFCYINYDLF
jgi:hypothetical protein